MIFSRQGSEAFIEAKLAEKALRHKKFGGSIYVLEPNVKEGQGGLRDLHAAFWVAKATKRGYFSALEEGVMSLSEKDSLEESVDYLHWVRNQIHFVSGRKKNRLTFDLQEQMAKLRGHFDAERELAVETFMRNYYLHATNISRLSDLIISRCLEPDETKKITDSNAIKLGDEFIISSGAITTVSENIFKKNPSSLVRVFEFAQKNKVRIDRKTQDEILTALETSELDLCNNKTAGSSFKKILAGKGLFEILNLMHCLKVLDALIPQFAAVRCKVQHDLYHIYTVDTHSIFAIKELEKLRTDYKEPYKLLSAIFADVEEKAVLALAVLLHDIGKAHGSGHAEKGAVMIPEICARIGFNEEQTELVTFLVREHLILANTAQYRDLHDEKLIINFAKTVGDDERLNLLYLLTFADVKAVGPEVWSEWKGTLFQELYFKARSVLEKGDFKVSKMTARLEKLKSSVLALAGQVSSSGVTAEEVSKHMSLLPPRYAFSNNAQSILDHIQYIKELDHNATVVKVRQVEEREYTELVIATIDVSGLFSMITGVMMANSVNILGAQINTLRNGVALDLLQVNTIYGKLLTDEVKLQRIEDNLKDVVCGRLKIETLIEKIRPSILDKKIKPAVPIRIEVDNEVSDIFTVLEIHTEDRLGLLFMISSALTSMGVIIHIAKVSTKGDTASDIFYIRDIFGQKIADESKVDSIKKGIIKVLQ
jgi:[protein-PII] uridylyltransferase